MNISKKIEYLHLLFNPVKLNVRSRITDEIEDMFNLENEFDELYEDSREEDLLMILSALKNALMEAKKDLKRARKKFKQKLIDNDEVLYYKKIVDDLIHQIKEIESNFKN